MFEVIAEIYQKCVKIRNSSYMEKFYRENFVFMNLFYLFIYLMLNSYF
jgi:hypothetical protein